MNGRPLRRLSEADAGGWLVVSKQRHDMPKKLTLKQLNAATGNV